MKIQEIYELAIKLGIENDLRGVARVKKNLARLKDKYERMGAEQKREFDKERLTNPYADSRVFVDHGREIKKVMSGIDIGPAEILIAKELGVDLIIGHHPFGHALADLGDVMHLQAEVLAGYGVPINIAEGLTKKRISEVARGISPINHYRTVDAAKLMGIGLMCSHTPCDNMAASFLDKVFKKAKPEFVGDVIKSLKEIEEYQEAIKQKSGPTLFAGHPDNYVGKLVLTEITGGTEGAVGIYERMAQAGIGTIVGMHMDEERKKEAQKHHINVVIAGHMSSDSLGVNLLLDELEKRGIEIIPISGLIRISRNKKRSAAAKPRKTAKPKSRRKK
ncbi:MAG: NGG1p interacting factor NIF3 [Patescibacteria group bacterium]|jgi:putative NIF3 family GTP cyclohydrolase 1 type 2|nr:NGG1p interacting factor NIF3 [Patescibacteria group bacterium]